MLRPYENRFPWTLDWNLLRTFMVVVEQGSVTRAAAFLGLKQPTVSSALKRLEATMGHVLVERKPNRFRITRAGRTLYTECSTIFGSVSHLPALLEAETEDLTGHISFVTASHVVSAHVDGVLESFARDHPGVTFSIVVSESTEVVSRIEQNRASLGICLLGKIPKNLDARVLYREFFALYCGPRHRLFDAGRIALSDLHGEPSVSFQTELDGGPLDAVGRLRERARLSPGLRGVSANLPELRRMIIANIGIGALPVHVAERDVKLGHLRQLPPTTRLPAIDIYLLANPRRQLTRPEAALLARFNDLIDTCPIEERTYGGTASKG